MRPRLILGVRARRGDLPAGLLLLIGVGIAYGLGLAFFALLVVAALLLGVGR